MESLFKKRLGLFKKNHLWPRLHSFSQLSPAPSVATKYNVLVFTGNGETTSSAMWLCSNLATDLKLCVAL